MYFQGTGFELSAARTESSPAMGGPTEPTNTTRSQGGSVGIDGAILLSCHLAEEIFWYREVAVIISCASVIVPPKTAVEGRALSVRESTGTRYTMLPR